MNAWNPRNDFDPHDARDAAWPPPAARPEELRPASESRPDAARIARALRARACPPDRVFDRLLPPALQAVSAQHWTHLAAAVRAAEWLDELDIRTVLDIGSGAGKFCVAAALASRARFIGVEQRGRLVHAARDLAVTLGVDDRVSFLHGTLSPSFATTADAFYLYNPFGENLFGPEDHIDAEVQLGQHRYERDVSLVEWILRTARPGTYVLTYNGFGGHLPDTYEDVYVDHDLPSVLRLWRHTGISAPRWWSGLSGRLAGRRSA
jgi:SAM-dependent methyltransferase